GSVIDDSQWFALLRAASAYHAFRREHPYTISTATVAGFLLSDRRFPRSVACCLKTVSLSLDRMKRDYDMPHVDNIRDLNESLRQRLKSPGIEQIITSGLHEYLDHIQLHLIALSARISKQYFG